MLYTWSHLGYLLFVLLALFGQFEIMALESCIMHMFQIVNISLEVFFVPLLIFRNASSFDCCEKA